MNDLTAASIAPIAPSDVPIRPERYYRPELDVLRFSAFLMVFCAPVIPANQNSPCWLSVASEIYSAPGELRLAP